MEAGAPLCGPKVRASPKFTGQNPKQQRVALRSWPSGRRLGHVRGALTGPRREPAPPRRPPRRRGRPSAGKAALAGRRARQGLRLGLPDPGMAQPAQPGALPSEAVKHGGARLEQTRLLDRMRPQVPSVGQPQASTLPTRESGGHLK